MLQGLKKKISLFLSIITALTGFLTPAVEANFWQDRRRAAQSAVGTSGFSDEKNNRLAALPDIAALSASQISPTGSLDIRSHPEIFPMKSK